LRGKGVFAPGRSGEAVFAESSRSRSISTFGDVFRGTGGCYRQWQAQVRQAPGDNGAIEGLTFMAKSKLRVLYGEGEEDILKQQAAAMEKAGHTVHQAIGRKGVQEALNKSVFDLVVLGATLTRNDRHHLPYMVKKVNAETSVLVMHADGSRHPYVDACTDTGASVEHVLARMESMTITGMMPAAKAAGVGR